VGRGKMKGTIRENALPKPCGGRETLSSSHGGRGFGDEKEFWGGSREKRLTPFLTRKEFRAREETPK